jgi:hypothetical protein
MISIANKIATISLEIMADMQIKRINIDIIFWLLVSLYRL